MANMHKETRHHLIGKSLKNEYNVHADCNRIRMDEHRHNALHALFGVLLAPKEQTREFSYILESILSDEAKALFSTLSNMSDSQFYRKEVLKNYKKNEKHNTYSE